MVDIATIAFYLGVVAYSVAATLFFLDLARRDGGDSRPSLAPRLLALGAALHAVHVVTASLLSACARSILCISRSASRR